MMVQQILLKVLGKTLYCIEGTVYEKSEHNIVITTHKDLNFLKEQELNITNTIINEKHHMKTPSIYSNHNQLQLLTQKTKQLINHIKEAVTYINNHINSALINNCYNTNISETHFNLNTEDIKEQFNQFYNQCKIQNTNQLSNAQYNKLTEKNTQHIVMYRLHVNNISSISNMSSNIKSLFDIDTNSIEKIISKMKNSTSLSMDVNKTYDRQNKDLYITLSYSIHSIFYIMVEDLFINTQYNNIPDTYNKKYFLMKEMVGKFKPLKHQTNVSQTMSKEIPDTKNITTLNNVKAIIEESEESEKSATIGPKKATPPQVTVKKAQLNKNIQPPLEEKPIKKSKSQSNLFSKSKHTGSLQDIDTIGPDKTTSPQAIVKKAQLKDEKQILPQKTQEEIKTQEESEIQEPYKNIQSPQATVKKAQLNKNIQQPQAIVKKAKLGQNIQQPQVTVKKAKLGQNIQHPQATVKKAKLGQNIQQPQATVKKAKLGQNIQQPQATVKKAELSKNIQSPQAIVKKAQLKDEKQILPQKTQEESETQEESAIQKAELKDQKYNKKTKLNPLGVIFCIIIMILITATTLVIKSSVLHPQQNLKVNENQNVKVKE